MIKKHTLIFLLSLLIIALMAVYLMFGDLFKTSDYSNLIKVKSDIEDITIKKQGSEIKLFRKDGKWAVGKKSYPADAELIKKVEGDLKALKISDQVSKGDFPSRYDLDPEKAVEINISFANKDRKTFSAGKKSSTNNHIYIRRDGKPEIYLAAGSLDSVLTKTEDDFRNRIIFKIPSASVLSFEITYKGRTFSFIKKSEEKTVKVQAAEAKQDIEDKTVKTDSWTLTGSENIRLDAEKTGSLISDFNPLRAQSFVSDEKKPSNQLATVKIKTQENFFELAVFEKTGDKYPAKSSESDFIFNIDEGIVKKFFIENIEGLKDPLK